MSGISRSSTCQGLTQPHEAAPAWVQNFARTILEAKSGMKTRNAGESAVVEAPLAKCAAVVLGLANPFSNDEGMTIMEAVLADPLLSHLPPRPEVLLHRARLVCWCLTGEGPALSEEGIRELSVLSKDVDPFTAARLLIGTSPEASVEEIARASEVREGGSASSKSPHLPRADEFESAWIRENVTLLSMIPEEEFEGTALAVAAFFDDALPLTIGRVLAFEAFRMKARTAG